LGHGASWQCSPVSKSLKFGTIAQAEINLAECSRVGSIRMNQLRSARNNQEELGSIGSKQDQLGSRWKHMRKRFPGRSPTSKQLGLGSTSNWYWIPKTLFVFWLLVPIFKKIFLCDPDTDFQKHLILLCSWYRLQKHFLFLWSLYRFPKTQHSWNYNLKGNLKNQHLWNYILKRNLMNQRLWNYNLRENLKNQHLWNYNLRENFKNQHLRNYSVFL